MGRSTVRRDASRVEVAENLSAFTAGAATGDISGDKLDSLARAARRLKPTEREHLNTPELADAALHLSADEFDVRVRAAAERAKHDHGLSDAIAARNNSEFRHWFDSRSGMDRFSGQLDPERYEILHTAIDDATATLARQADEPTSKDANLAAAALISLLEGGDGVRRPGRPLVTVVVDADTVAVGPHPNSIRQTANGSPVPPETIHRHLCDAQVRTVVLDELGVPLNVGRKYRTATDGQWTAIKALYASCAWDCCDRPISWCQLHHIHEWEQGGPTDLCNLVPLCSQHHHQVHEGQWTIKMLPDRALKIYQPDGVLSATVKPPTRRPPPNLRPLPLGLAEP